MIKTLVNRRYTRSCNTCTQNANTQNIMFIKEQIKNSNYIISSNRYKIRKISKFKFFFSYYVYLERDKY